MTDPIAIDVQHTARQLDAMLLAYPELEVDDDLRDAIWPELTSARL